MCGIVFFVWCVCRASRIFERVMKWCCHFGDHEKYLELDAIRRTTLNIQANHVYGGKYLKSM